MENDPNDSRPAAAEEGAEAPVPPADPAPEGDAAARQLDEQRDKYLRLAAEYDNYRKRMAKERVELAPRAQGELVRQLLDGLDDLARFAHLDPAQTDAKTVVDGAAMVERKLHKALAAAGLAVLDPRDEPFDPNHHEAVATQPAASADEDDRVAQVYQVGYLFNGQLLRPARVVVKQWNG